MRRTRLRAGLRGVAPVQRIAGAAVGVGAVAGRTQLGDAMGFGRLTNPIAQNEAWTKFWSETGVAGYTGQFADITVTRTAGTELLFWAMYGSDSQNSNNTAGVAATAVRNLYLFRDSTQINSFSEALPMIQYYVDTNSPQNDPTDQLVGHGACLRNINYIDADDVSGSKVYKFHYKNNSPAGDNFSSQTNEDIAVYYIFLLERKKK